MRGNQVVFRFSSDWLDGHKPAPIQHLWVKPLSTGAPAALELQSVDYNGRAVRDLIYGALPSGMTEKAKAVPLRIGQVYDVELLALGGGGTKQFVILPGPGPAQPIAVLQQ